MMPPFLEAMRPQQWVKNLLVLTPLLFTTKERGQDLDHFRDPASWLAALLAFASFCLAASSIYLLNDLVDREHDSHHPKKRLRPIASGRLSPAGARATLALTLLGSLGLGWIVRQGAGEGTFLAWPTGYLLLNLAYSFWLKRLVVIDCMCIALGFQLRVMAGAAAISVEASHWLLLCTFFFSLFLAFCKRYEEVGRQDEATGRTRATMEDYTLSFLDMMIGPLAALSILSYALYTVSAETFARHGHYRLMYTVPIVVYGVFRYLFLVYRRREGGDPARLLFRDPPLVLSGAAYAGLVVVLLRLLPSPP